MRNVTFQLVILDIVTMVEVAIYLTLDPSASVHQDITEAGVITIYAITTVKMEASV